MSRLLFDGQRDDETVKFIFRRHIITARKGLWFLLFAIIIGILPLFMWPGDHRMLWIFLCSITVGILGMGYSYLLWYFSIYIVTDQRVRQIVQKGLFKKVIVDLGLDKIQSVSISTPGILASLFNYGTILIQTNVGDLVISMTSHPNQVYNQLQNTIKECAK